MPYQPCGCCDCQALISFFQGTHIQYRMGWRFGSSGPVYHQAYASGEITHGCYPEPPAPTFAIMVWSGVITMSRPHLTVSGSLSAFLTASHGSASATFTSVPGPYASVFDGHPDCYELSESATLRILAADGGPCGCGAAEGDSSGAHYTSLSDEYTTAELIEDAKSLTVLDTETEVPQDEESPHLVGSAIYLGGGSSCETTASRMLLRFPRPGNGGNCIRVSFQLMQSNLDGSSAVPLSEERTQLEFTPDFSGYDPDDAETWPTDTFDLPWPSAADKVVYPVDYVFACLGCGEP